jgi:cytochrome P450 family 135
LFAGHETTANALAWAGVLLAAQPADYRALATGGDDYADAVLQEVLRLRPSAASSARCATGDTELDGFAVPAGTNLAMLTLSRHDAVNFPEPERFRPDRWLAEPRPPAFASLPFGNGVHRCVGEPLATLESRLVLQELARRVPSLRPAPGRPERQLSFSVVLVPSRGGRVILDP